MTQNNMTGAVIKESLKIARLILQSGSDLH